MDDQNKPQGYMPSAPDMPDSPNVELAPEYAMPAIGIEPSTVAMPAGEALPDLAPATVAAPAVDPVSMPVAEAPAPIFGAPNPPSIPTPAPFITTTPGSGPTPGSKRKRNLILGGIIAGAIVVLGSGAALAYNLYYQNAQKVVTDSIINVMRAKTASFTSALAFENDTATVNVTLDGAGSAATSQVNAKISAKISGKTYAVTAAGVLDDKSDLYFKVGDVAKLVDEFSALIPSDSQQAVNDIVKKVDNKWIKVSADDMKSVSEDASKTQTCMTDAIKKLQDDKQASKQIGDLYRNNQFIIIDQKLGSKDGSLGYVLKGDASKSKAFVLGLKDTTVYKDLHNCDNSFVIDEKDLNDVTKTDNSKDNSRVELWVSRWSHQVTKFAVTSTINDSSSDTKVTFTLEPVFNKAVKVETPAGATTFKQLSQDISDLMSQYSTSSVYGDSAYDPYAASYDY